MEKKPWFLGPKGENSDVMERFILEAIRDYISWRRNFHPEDERIISKKERRSLEFQESFIPRVSKLGEHFFLRVSSFSFFSLHANPLLF